MLIGSSVSSAAARQIEVVAGWAKPPYVIADNDSGFEIELVREILQAMGHSLKPTYIPLGRTVRQLESGNADIVMSVTLSHDIDPALLSDEYVRYQNTAITLASRKLAITELEDLAGFTVLAFQTADRILGPRYAAMVAQHAGYGEIADQHRQVKMLLLGSVDVAVMDKNIFSWLRSQLPLWQQKEVRFHDFFQRTSNRAAILDDSLRAGFNRELARMRTDGRYQALADKYRLDVSAPPPSVSDTRVVPATGL